MNNYEYIVASLPVPGQDSLAPDASAVAEFILGQCSPADAAVVQLLLDSFDRSKLDADFYAKALSCRNPFIREYLRFDLLVRNTKVEYLNRMLERPVDTDIIPLPGSDPDERPSCPDYEQKPAVLDVLGQSDILARERGLDSLMWDKADELTAMHLFDLDVILAVVAKLMITDRWTKLDPVTGRQMFRCLVQEIRNTR